MEKIVNIEEFVANDIKTLYDKIISTIDNFFPSFTSAYRDVQNGRLGEEKSRNGYFINLNSGDNHTLNVFYSLRGIYLNGSGTQSSTSASFIKEDRISFHLHNNDSAKTQNNTNVGDSQGTLILYGSTHKMFIIEIKENEELLFIVNSGGRYTSVYLKLKQGDYGLFVIKSPLRLSDNLNNGSSSGSNKVFVRLNNIYNHRLIFKNKNNETIYVTSNSNYIEDFKSGDDNSLFLNVNNKIYGVKKYVDMYRFNSNDFVDRYNGRTDGYVYLTTEDEINVGHISGHLLSPEQELTIGANTYKFFPIDLHDGNSQTKLGIVVRIA